MHEIQGLSHFIQKLKEKHIKVALATAANAENRSLILNGLGCHNTFDVIVGDEHIQKGKPDPEIYIKAAEQLHVHPTECLVFEDAPLGVLSAQKAGMKVIGVLTSYKLNELPGVEFGIKSFDEIEVV